jgi:hypothetical protein
MAELTKRELEIQEGLKSGMSHESLAEKLQIKMTSFKTYLGSLRRKTGKSKQAAPKSKTVVATTAKPNVPRNAKPIDMSKAKEAKTNKPLNERVADFQMNMCRVCTAKSYCNCCGFQKVYKANFPDINFSKI